MNKKNKILVGCLALLLALSVGYALFSETITINGTATAKGSFDITATCETGITSKLGTASSLGLVADRGYNNDTCTVVDDTVTFNTGLEYPGAFRFFTVKFTNEGSIDALINTTKSTISSQLCYKLGNQNTDTCITSSGDIIESDTGFRVGLYYYISKLKMEDKEGNLLSQSEMLSFLNNSTGDLMIKSGYSAYVIYDISFSHTDNFDNDWNKYSVEFNSVMNLDFKQATN